MHDPWQQKNAMQAIDIDITKINGTHGISCLPRDARGALNGIRSETFCSKIHGIHGIWAMDTINIDIIQIDGTHGISLLPR